MRSFCAVYILLFLTSSCVLHSPYSRPCIIIPDEWRLDNNEITTLANVRWWEQFNDHVLDYLILEALQNNQDLKVAIARVWEFYARLGVVSADLFPTITSTGSDFRSEASLLATPIPPGVKRTTTIYSIALNLSYELDIWGRIRSATEAALADFMGEIEARRTVVQSLVTSVASTYILMRQYDKQLDISQKTYKSRVESYNLAVARFKEGITSELDVTQAAAEMESALIQIKQFEILVPQQENLLSVLIGRNPQAIQRGLWLDDLQMPPVIPEGLPSQILEQRPDILEAEDLLVSTNARIGEARALFFPQISLTGSYGNASMELTKLFTGPARLWTYGISYLQTLFDAGKIASQVSEAKAVNVEAYHEYISAIQTAFREVDDALIAHKKFLEIVTVNVRRVKDLQEALKIANLQYYNGETDYLNVLDAQRNLFTAQLDYAEAQSNSFLSVIALYKALGGGWILEADTLIRG